MTQGNQSDDSHVRLIPIQITAFFAVAVEILVIAINILFPFPSTSGASTLEFDILKDMVFLVPSVAVVYILVRRYVSTAERSEKNLREERNLVSTVLDNVGSLVVVLDHEGKYLDSTTCAKRQPDLARRKSRAGSSGMSSYRRKKWREPSQRSRSLRTPSSQR